MTLKQLNVKSVKIIRKPAKLSNIKLDLLPQEAELYYIIPALRVEIANILSNEDYKQKEIAKALNISEAAVSQYISLKRGVKFSIPFSFKSQIKKEILEHIQNNKISKQAKKNKDILDSNISNLNKTFMKLLFEAKKQKITCKLCYNYSDGSCQVCVEEEDDLLEKGRSK